MSKATGELDQVFCRIWRTQLPSMRNIVNRATLAADSTDYLG